MITTARKPDSVPVAGGRGALALFAGGREMQTAED